jgi:hypothetical protein
VTAARWTNTAMRLRIDATGEHRDHQDQPFASGWVFMTVDNHGFMVDLSGIEGTLIDPTISLVTWGPIRDGAHMREGGCIVRTQPWRRSGSRFREPTAPLCRRAGSQASRA